jgi:uncharacterized protein (TIGR03083 family)
VDADESWDVVERERLRLADVLDGLTDEEWHRPSLCEGWRVRDVVGHMLLVPRAPGLGPLLWRAVRARGDLNRVSREMSIEYASSRSTAELAAEVRELAGSRRMPAVTNYRNILYDTLVHSQDITVPLEREHPMPVGAASVAADRVWSMVGFGARRRFGGFLLRATDVEWVRGSGTREVAGPMEALLLLLTGRTAVAVPRLSGAGVAELG